MVFHPTFWHQHSQPINYSPYLYRQLAQQKIANAAAELLTRPLEPDEWAELQNGTILVHSGGRIMDHSPLGLGEIAYDLHAAYGFSYQEIAGRLLRDETTIRRYTMLAIFLPPKAKTMLRHGSLASSDASVASSDASLSLPTAIILASLKNKAQVLTFLHQCPQPTQQEAMTYLLHLQVPPTQIQTLNKPSSQQRHTSPDPRQELAATIEDILAGL